MSQSDLDTWEIMDIFVKVIGCSELCDLGGVGGTIFFRRIVKIWYNK